MAIAACVACNTSVRFPGLARRAEAWDCDLVATGHYARRVRFGRELFVARGVDPEKDQSYFLARLSPGQLARALFPVGSLTKDEVRAAALERRGVQRHGPLCVSSSRPFPRAE